MVPCVCCLEILNILGKSIPLVWLRVLWFSAASAGSGQRAAGSGQRAAGSGQRAAGSISRQLAADNSTCLLEQIKTIDKSGDVRIK